MTTEFDLTSLTFYDLLLYFCSQFYLSLPIFGIEHFTRDNGLTFPRYRHLYILILHVDVEQTSFCSTFVDLRGYFRIHVNTKCVLTVPGANVQVCSTLYASQLMAQLFSAYDNHTVPVTDGQTSMVMIGASLRQIIEVVSCHITIIFSWRPPILWLHISSFEALIAKFSHISSLCC